MNILNYIMIGIAVAISLFWLIDTIIKCNRVEKSLKELERKEKSKSKKTNFDKITESVESLANVIVQFDCEYDEYKVYGTYDCCDDREEAIKLQIEWLQKECD